MPVSEKIIGALVILSLVIAVIKSARYLWPGIKQAFKGSKHVQAIFTGIGFMLFAKMLDSSGRLFPGLVESFAPYNIPMQFTEETMEMIMAFLYLCAPILYLGKQRR